MWWHYEALSSIRTSDPPWKCCQNCDAHLPLVKEEAAVFACALCGSRCGGGGAGGAGGDATDAPPSTTTTTSTPAAFVCTCGYALCSVCFSHDLLPRQPSHLMHNRGAFAFEVDAQGHCTQADILKHLSRTVNMSGPTPVSILDPADPDRDVCQRKIFGTLPWDSPQESRAVATLIGMCLGDSIGAPMEFNDVRYGVTTVTGVGSGSQGAFSLKPGQYTDDSSMGLCLADSLLYSRGGFSPVDSMLRYQAWWNCGYNNGLQGRGSVGLGGNISCSFSSFTREGCAYTTAGDKETSGVGSIMRLGAVVPAFAAPADRDRAMDVARRSSLVTHQGEEAAECCRLLAFVCHRGLHGDGTAATCLGDLSEFTSCEEGVQIMAQSGQQRPRPGESPADRNWNWKDPNFRYSPQRAARQPGYIGSYAMDGLVMALHCVYSTSSFAEAVLKCANLGGDADSVTAVAGQIAGAIYGVEAIPQDWIRALQQWDCGGDVALRAYKLFHQHYDTIPAPIPPPSQRPSTSFYF
eukprot:gnl/Spiro4/5114_TR2561_c0_g1_i1.p1 gnl/Spiro4/5114_TR2561_c0_g1~~gnl/Spiro4/5114_TR2561_c0_g1_i1.p1  ORF type:complete len:535 (+),score=69.17 gnl/Spiro4/5114_TR2561_c0_g1_i1:45-1607(+)